MKRTEFEKSMDGTLPHGAPVPSADRMYLCFSYYKIVLDSTDNYVSSFWDLILVLSNNLELILTYLASMTSGFLKDSNTKAPL